MTGGEEPQDAGGGTWGMPRVQMSLQFASICWRLTPGYEGEMWRAEQRTRAAAMSTEGVGQVGSRELSGSGPCISRPRGSALWKSQSSRRFCLRDSTRREAELPDLSSTHTQCLSCDVTRKGQGRKAPPLHLHPHAHTPANAHVQAHMLAHTHTHSLQAHTHSCSLEACTATHIHKPASAQTCLYTHTFLHTHSHTPTYTNTFTPCSHSHTPALSPAYMATPPTRSHTLPRLYTHIHLYMPLYTASHAPLHAHTPALSHAQPRTLAHTCTRTCLCTQMCSHTHASAHAHALAHIQARIHMCLHTRIHACEGSHTHAFAHSLTLIMDVPVALV